MRKIYNKLIRDRIPAIIEAAGKTYAVEVLPDDEYRQALAAKLVEEAEEARTALAGGSEAEVIKELGDLQEVIAAILAATGASAADVQRVQARRRHERGAFDKRFFLKWTDDPEVDDTS
jgi:predicted house-cleaning noncanonical NTP pyrophosphatase (MazG superfamily)